MPLFAWHLGNRALLATAGVAAGAGAVLAWPGGAAAPAEAGAWAALLLVAVLLLGRAVPALLGPVFFYDAVRTARRGRYAILRCAYAALLLVVLFLLYLEWFGQDLRGGPGALLEPGRLPPSEVARFASEFFHLFLTLQYLTVLALAPAYAGGAIAEEKETGTLEYLLTTHLSNREIVLGKLASRVANLVLLLLTGLPFLSLLLLLGGIDPSLLIYGFAATLLSVFSVSCLGMAASASVARPRDAVFLTYVLLVGYQVFASLCCGSYFSAGLTPDSLPSLLWIVSNAGSALGLWAQFRDPALVADNLGPLLFCQLTFHTAVGAGCLAWAVTRLRQGARPQDRPAEQTAEPDPDPVPNVALEPPRPRLRPAPVADNLMRWKELYVERGIELHPLGQQVLAVLAFGGLFVAAGSFFCGVLITILESTDSGFANTWTRVMLPAVAVVAYLGIALRAAGSISGERERQTLDSLLTTDLTVDEILSAKWAGCFWGVRAVLWVLAVVAGLGLITGGFFLLMAPMLAAAVVVHALFAAHVGLYCSLVCRTTLRATVVTVLVLLGAWVGHFVVYLAASAVLGLTGRSADWLAAFHVYGLTPPLTLAGMVFAGRVQEHEVPAIMRALASASAGLVLYAAAAGLLWLRLRQRFGPVTGRMR